MAEKARLRRSGKEIVANAEQPQLVMPGSEEIVEVKEQSWGSIIAGWMRSTGFFLVGTALILLVLYLGLSATILFRASLGGHNIIVARGTFVGNVATVGRQVYVSGSTPDQDNIMTKIKTGFFGAPDASVGQVESGLYDQVTIQNGHVLVNGKDLGSAGNLHISGGSSVKLSGQYLVRCEYGACGTAGSWLVVPQTQVYGEVKRG